MTLEAYAYECASWIEQNRDATHLPDQEFPEWNGKLPDLPAYPDDTEGWRAVDRKLAGRALNLRNMLTSSQGMIWTTGEYSEHEFGSALEEHASTRGLDAWELRKPCGTSMSVSPSRWSGTTLRFSPTHNNAQEDSRRAERAKK